MADALLASERILEAIGDASFESYFADWKIQAAVERQFLIIGEAIVRIRDLEPPIFQRFPDSREAINFRNVLVHLYDQIEPDRVYDIVKRDVPVLHAALVELVNEASRQGL